MNCKICNKYLDDSWPQYKKDKGTTCPECMYLQNLISEKEYIETACFWTSQINLHADIIDGEIILHSGKKSFYEIQKEDYRKNPFYYEWRRKVFERDKYTCQKCQTIGGRLEAHHIKPYKKYVQLRYVVSNGKTLCANPCHKKEHKYARLLG